MRYRLWPVGVAILGKRVAMSLNERAQCSQAFPSNILRQAGLDLVEVQFERLLSLQARYTKNQSVAWAVIRDRDCIDRRQPSQPETASRQAVRFDGQANGQAALAIILR